MNHRAKIQADQINHNFSENAGEETQIDAKSGEVGTQVADYNPFLDYEFEELFDIPLDPTLETNIKGRVEPAAQQPEAEPRSDKLNFNSNTSRDETLSESVLDINTILSDKLSHTNEIGEYLFSDHPATQVLSSFITLFNALEGTHF